MITIWFCVAKVPLTTSTWFAGEDYVRKVESLVKSRHS
jgi:hypothetical protein